MLKPKAGPAHSAIVRYAILLVGAFATLAIALVLFGVNVSQLILGGALTTVFVSIAAQQALGNVFAGLVLVFARPFKVGDAIRLRAGALGGTLDGIVTDIGITYVRFDTDGSVMSVPNSQVLNAIVGPSRLNQTSRNPPSSPTASRPRKAARSSPSRARPGPSSRAAGRHAERRAGWSASHPRHANRCGGRLSAKGATRIQPNGIPRRQ